MTRHQSLGPLDPIFRVKTRYGGIEVGNTPGTLPVFVTINQAAGQDDPTSTSPILFTAVFSEPVTGFTDADALITGTAGATSAVVTEITPFDGTTYEVSVPMVTYPFIIGSVTHANLDGPGGLAMTTSHVYVTSFNDNALTVVDISDPTTPAVIGSVTDATTLQRATGVVVDGNYAYVCAQTSNRVTVVDVSNPAAPSIVGSVSNALLSSPTYLVKDGNYCYVTSNGGDRLVVVDVSNPSAPTIAGSVSSTQLDQAWDVAKSGSHVFVTAVGPDRLVAIDVSTPASPTITSSIQNVVTLSGPRGVVISGSYAFVGAIAAQRVVAIDISNPASMSIAGSLVTTERPWDLVISSGDSNLWTIASDDDVVAQLDISAPTTPVELLTLTDPGFGTTNGNVTAAGSFVCASGFDSDTLVVIQVAP